MIGFLFCFFNYVLIQYARCISACFEHRQPKHFLSIFILINHFLKRKKTRAFLFVCLARAWGSCGNFLPDLIPRVAHALVLGGFPVVRCDPAGHN